MSIELDNQLTPKSIVVTLMGTGVLGVIAAGMLAVANDSRVALSVAEQHGQELLMIRGELAAVRAEMLQRTTDRFTSKDGINLEKYIERRFLAIEKKLDNLEKKLE
jgi:hypothetical protein